MPQLEKTKFLMNQAIGNFERLFCLIKEADKDELEEDVRKMINMHFDSDLKLVRLMLSIMTSLDGDSSDLESFVHYSEECLCMGNEAKKIMEHFRSKF